MNELKPEISEHVHSTLLKYGVYIPEDNYTIIIDDSWPFSIKVKMYNSSSSSERCKQRIGQISPRGTRNPYRTKLNTIIYSRSQDDSLATLMKVNNLGTCDVY